MSRHTVRALHSYKACGQYDISFAAGDLFRVLDDSDAEWVHVHRLQSHGSAECSIDGAVSGMVPKSFVRAVHTSGARHGHAQEPPRRKSASSGTSSNVSTSSSTPSLSSASTGSSPSVVSNTTTGSNGSTGTVPPLGVVRYDFQAERADEMSVQAGDSLVLLAQTAGWYLVKHISRAVHPGLVPSTYVSVCDTALLLSDTGKGIALDLPTIDEWRKRLPLMTPIAEVAANCNASNRAETTSTSPSKSSQPCLQSPPKSSQPRLQSPPAGHSSVAGRLVCVKVHSYRLRNAGGTVFHLAVRRAGGIEHRVHRTYRELFTMQALLLDAFPAAAGYEEQPRTIPFLPAPSADVSIASCTQRKLDINVYLEKLLQMPSQIRRSGIVVDFFAPWPAVDNAAHRAEILVEPAVDDRQYNPSASHTAPSLLRKHDGGNAAVPFGRRHAGKVPPRLQLPDHSVKHQHQTAPHRRPSHPMLISAPINGKSMRRSDSSDCGVSYGPRTALDDCATLVMPPTLADAVPVPGTVLPKDKLTTARGATPAKGSKYHAGPGIATAAAQHSTVDYLAKLQISDGNSVTDIAPLSPPHAADTIVPETSPQRRRDLIKVKLIESSIVSHFKIAPDIAVTKLRRKMQASLGVPTEAHVYFEDVSDGSIKPLATDEDLRRAVAGVTAAGQSCVVMHA